MVNDSTETSMATYVFELVHHFGEFARIHFFVHVLEHFIHLLHVLDHDVLRIGLLNLKRMERWLEDGEIGLTLARTLSMRDAMIRN